MTYLDGGGPPVVGGWLRQVLQHRRGGKRMRRNPIGEGEGCGQPLTNDAGRRHRSAEFRREEGAPVAGGGHTVEGAKSGGLV
jgi:hypothetical protein